MQAAVGVQRMLMEKAPWGRVGWGLRSVKEFACAQ